MRRIYKDVAVLLISGLLGCVGAAQAAPPQSRIAHPHSVHDDRAEAEITALLQTFLAKVDDPAMHANFWADDLIYVSSDGKLRSKEQIVSAVRADASLPASLRAPRSETFAAENIKVRSYGTVAVVNFTLVAHEAPPAGPRHEGETRRYRNSGVFLRQGDGWRVVSWQATAVPEPPKD
jgi:hypothetical protein